MGCRPGSAMALNGSIAGEPRLEAWCGKPGTGRRHAGAGNLHVGAPLDCCLTASDMAVGACLLDAFESGVKGEAAEAGECGAGACTYIHTYKGTCQAHVWSTVYPYHTQMVHGNLAMYVHYISQLGMYVCT